MSGNGDARDQCGRQRAKIYRGVLDVYMRGDFKKYFKVDST